MRKSLALGTVLFCLAAGFFAVGCDQVQSLLPAGLKSSAAPASAPAAGETGTGAAQGTVLAKVNSDVITVESFVEKIDALKTLSPEVKIDTLDAKKAYLNDLITQELVYQEAKARGIDKKKDVKDALEEFRKGVMARQLILDETKGIAVEPAEIENFYNQYKNEFASAPQIRAVEIVVPSEATAKEILIGLLQGGDFAAIARERSTSPSAAQGGDLGFVDPTTKFDKFNEVISTLEVGQVSQIFRGPDNNFYIARVEEKKGGEVPPLTEVYDQIKTGLLQQKQAQRLQELTDKLRREAKIEIKEELL